MPVPADVVAIESYPERAGCGAAERIHHHIATGGRLVLLVLRPGRRRRRQGAVEACDGIRSYAPRPPATGLHLCLLLLL